MRVGICGTHCSGKTTLARALAEEFDLALIEEVAAGFPRERRGALETQFAIMDAQIAAERAAGEDFVSDRTVIDNATYIEWCARHQPGAAPLSVYGTVWAGQDRAIAHLIDEPYDLLVVVDEYFPIEENGVRSLDAEQQAFVFSRLQGLVGFYTHAAGLEQVMRVRGDPATRLDRVGRAVMEIWDRPVEAC
jgi:nicotinamide riboside kinase